MSLGEILDEHKDSLARILRFAIPAVAGAVASLGGSGILERGAEDHLQDTEQLAARLNDTANYREYVEETIGLRAKCDAALEAFHFDRDDEGDYGRVLRACHTEGGIE